jgi:hypothetical protein
LWRPATASPRKEMIMLDKFPTDRQRAALLRFARALGSRDVALQRDECGDWRIEGQHGHVYATPGPVGAKSMKAGFQMFVLDWTARGWKAAKDVLPGVVCNDGDDEGAVFLDRLPTAAEAVSIRKWCGIAKKRMLSDAERERLRATGFTVRLKPQPLPAFALETGL